MSKSKRQSMLVIGVALILIGGIMLWFSLSLPRVYVLDDSSVSDEIVADSENSTSQNKSSYTDNSVNYPININTCTVEELMTIDGIGESKASAIIEYREYLGSYDSVEQIKNIRGIGDSVYQNISPYLCV